MKLYIMRHGETDWNQERRLQGRSDIPLNEQGRKLALETAKEFENITFDAAYTSPLLRAKETAAILLSKTKTPIIEEDRLIEMAFGEYEGLCCAKDNWEIPEKEFENFFFHPEQYSPPKGGESFKVVINRVSSFLDDIVPQNKHSNSLILIICHGVVVNAFLKILKKRPISRFWENTVQKNCAVNIIEMYGNEIKILEEGIVYYSDTGAKTPF